MNRSVFISLTLLILSVIGCSDSKREIRSFSQNDSLPRSEQADTANASSSPSIRWHCPSGWTEVPASGMRLATFTVTDTNAQAECTVIPLAQDGGGPAANVKRWLSQLHIPAKSDDEINRFIRQQTVQTTPENISFTVFNFTSFASGNNDQSMLAAIMPLESHTIFVKFVAPRSILIQNMEKFVSLVKSISVQ